MKRKGKKKKTKHKTGLNTHKCRTRLIFSTLNSTQNGLHYTDSREKKKRDNFIFFPFLSVRKKLPVEQ